MKKTKLDIYVDEDSDRKLHELKARHEIPVPRLRGMAVEKFVENSDAEEYIKEREEDLQ
jgi:hypothetical protein